MKRYIVQYKYGIGDTVYCWVYAKQFSLDKIFFKGVIHGQKTYSGYPVVIERPLPKGRLHKYLTDYPTDRIVSRRAVLIEKTKAL